MRLIGHTPLSKMPAEKISVQQKTILSSLWVESVEEFTAMMAAMEDAEKSADNSMLITFKKGESSLLEGVPEEALAPWRQAYAAGSLGCLVDPEILKTFRIQGRIGSPGSVISQLSDSPLPPRVELMSCLFPVRDQGCRGTCVAFASTALREYLEGCLTDLSEQFLYWACKSLDGYPDEGGTFIHTAMSALSTKGICSGDVWPYNPEPVPGNESQSPPPDGAEQSALEFAMPYTRTVAPNCINHYKQVLSGADGLGGMPVVIASLVFNSWFRSAATRQTGKITMPLPGEEPLAGGHAMLIVGYQDDTSVPGGGYFIVRNSWGENWAAVSPEAAGHALMPYAYVEQCVVEAFSGQLLSEKTVIQENNNVGTKINTAVKCKISFEERYIYTLRRDARDIEGKLLRAGTRVIRHPDAPDEFMEDTASNRRLFEEKHYAWSDKIRQQSLFPSLESLSNSLTNKISESRALCQEFTAAIDSNIKSSVGHSIPDINLSPMLYGLAWMPKISKVELIADLSDELIKAVCRNGQIPDDVAPTSEWQNVLHGSNCLKVYYLSSKFGNFSVVSAYVTPIDFSKTGNIKITKINSEITEIVRNIYRIWDKKQQSEEKFTFYTIGNSQQLSERTKGVAGSDHLILLSGLDKQKKWQTVSSPQFAAGLYLRNFIERLYPETRQQKISNVKHAVDRYTWPDDGNILLEKIAEETGYRRTSIKEAFNAMQDSKHYECYKVNGEIAIRPVKDRKQKVLQIETEPSFVRYHIGMFGGAVITLASWRMGALLFGEKISLISLLLGGLIIHTGKCIEVAIKRKTTE